MDQDLTTLRNPIQHTPPTHLAASGLLARLKTACSNCSLRELCMPMGLSVQEMSKLDDLVFVRRSIKRGEHLFRVGEPFDSLYAARTGFFKTKLLLVGLQQVTGFHMAGELMGMHASAPSDIHAIRLHWRIATFASFHSNA